MMCTEFSLKRLMLWTATEKSVEELWAEAEFVSLRKPNSSETLPGPPPARTPRRAEDRDTNHADVGPCVGQPVCGCTEHRTCWTSINLAPASLP